MKRTLLFLLAFISILNVFSVKESYAESSKKDDKIKQMVLQQKNDFSVETKKIRSEFYEEILNSKKDVISEPLELQHTISKQSKSSVNATLIKYPEVNFKGYNVHLYPESSLTPQETLVKYKDVYEIIKKDFKDEDFFDKEFLDYLTVFYMDKDISDKLKNKLSSPDRLESFLTEMDLATDVYLNNETLLNIENKNTTQEELNMDRPSSLEGAVTKENAILDDPYTKQEIEEQENEENNQTLSRSGYNRWQSADYALSWWCLTNNRDYPYYAKYYNQSLRTGINALPYNGYLGKTQSSPRRAWNDCANFVSQSLSRGGLRQTSEWNYKDGFLQRPTHSWGGSVNLGSYLDGRFGKVSTNRAKTGDVAQIVRKATGRRFHTTLITKDAGNGVSNKYLTYHSVDRKNFSANNVFSMYDNVVLYFYHIY